MAKSSAELLQRMLQRVLDNQSLHSGRFLEIEQRLTSLEIQIGNTEAVMSRLVRDEARIGRLERRLAIAARTPP